MYSNTGKVLTIGFGDIIIGIKKLHWLTEHN